MGYMKRAIWTLRRVAAAMVVGVAVQSSESAASPGSSAGVTFSVHGMVEGQPAKAEPATSPAEGSVVTCSRVEISLSIGRLSVKNDSHDARVSFSDLPPGTYGYTATCHAAAHHHGIVRGTVAVESDGPAMVELDVKVPLTPYDISGGGTYDSQLIVPQGASFGTSIGTPDQIGGDLDGKVRDLTVLTSVGYVTSRASHQGIDALAITDLGIWNLAASFTPERRLSFSGSLTGLAKTPYGLDTRTLQGATGAIAYAFHKHLALGGWAGWSPGLAGTKDVRSAGLGVTWRKRQSEFVKTEFRLGATGLQIRPDGDGSSPRGVAQLDASAELQLCWNTCEQRYGATSIGFDAGIPIYHSDADSGAVGSNLDASLGFHIGNFMRISKTFDVYLDVAWRDRGDRRDASTELPVLVGGFDQLQMSLGAIFYFGFGASTVGAGERDVYGVGPE